MRTSLLREADRSFADEGVFDRRAQIARDDGLSIEMLEPHGQVGIQAIVTKVLEENDGRWVGKNVRFDAGDLEERGGAPWTCSS